MASLWDDAVDPYTAQPQQPGGMLNDALAWLYRQGGDPQSGFRRYLATSGEALGEAPAGIAQGVSDAGTMLHGVMQRQGMAEAGLPPAPESELAPVAPGVRTLGGLSDLLTGGYGVHGVPPGAGASVNEVRGAIPGLLEDVRGGKPFSTPPGPSSPTGAGSVSEGGLWTPSAPAIIRPPEGLDYRGINMAARPDVPQSPLDRPPTWAKKLPEKWAALDSPETWERYQRAAAIGLPEGAPGGREWYNTMPLLRAFMEINPSTGAQDFRRYIDYVGASSPDNVVPQNIRTASWLYHADKQGLDLPTIYRNERGDATMYPPEVKARIFPRDEAGNELTGAAKRAVISAQEEDALRSQFGLPSGYGGKAQASWVGHAGNIRSGGGFDLMTNPKPPSFVQNLLGNYEPFTIDRHNMRVMSGWTPEGKYPPGFADAPPTQAYGYLERLQQEYARRLGLAPAQTQAATWLGGETGVKSDLGSPFVGEFENKLNIAAQRARISPQEMLRDFVLGNRPL